MNEEPPIIDFRVDLARPTDPVLFSSRGFVAPQSINVHDCKRAIFFVGNLDTDSSPLVVD